MTRAVEILSPPAVEVPTSAAMLDETFFAAVIDKLEAYLAKNEPSPALRFVLDRKLPSIMAAVMEGGAI